MTNKIKVAINGYGRIGRNILRALYENKYRDRIEIVAINDLGSAKIHLHLTKYDSVHGFFKEKVSYVNGHLIVNGDKIKVLNEGNPELLPWKDLGVDIVYECTGCFTSKDAASRHLDAGAKRVIISAPATGADATIVYGVNHQLLNSDSLIISNASCTTNCLAPVAKVLNDTVGIEQGAMTTIHAYTSDQNLTDDSHKDVYRARSATQSMIPTKTGAATAVGLVLPELSGRLQGMAVRVPTVNVSLVDFHFIASKDTTVKAINQLMKQASIKQLKGILNYNEEPLVSIDFNHCSASSTFDSTQTCVNGRWVKVMAWYDNEWGFSNRMLDTSLALSELSIKSDQR